MSEGPDVPVVISYSMGSSSKWLIEAVINGVLPRPERIAVASADTGGEHDWSYEDRERVRERCRQHGIPFLDARADESLTEHLLSIPTQTREIKRLDHPPLWIAKGNGRGRAQHRCTRAFKVAPMRRAVSDWLKAEGLPKLVTKWVGFSRDEVHRAHKTVGNQDVAWERLDFPAIRLGKVRGQLREELRAFGQTAPAFSMCVFCPFKSDDRWRQTPESGMQVAERVDDAIRNCDEIGLTEGPAFLTDALIPVRALVRGERRQPVLPGLESYCDSGACFL